MTMTLAGRRDRIKIASVCVSDKMPAWSDFHVPSYQILISDGGIFFASQQPMHKAGPPSVLLAFPGGLAKVSSQKVNSLPDVGDPDDGRYSQVDRSHLPYIGASLKGR